MLVHDWAGGVVFCGEKVLLLKDKKGDWVLPRLRVNKKDIKSEVLINKVKEDIGTIMEMVTWVGTTSYEISSDKKQKSICNKIDWFIVKTSNESSLINEKNTNVELNLFTIQEAMDNSVCERDKSLINLSYKNYIKKVAIAM